MDVPSPFLQNSQIQWAWDATSLSLFKECPRKYYYKMVCGYTPKEDRVHLTFGQFYHSALEEYDHARVFGGKDHEQGVRDALLRALKDSYGWVSDNPNKNRDTLIRSVVWYLDHFEQDPAKVHVLENGRPAVELSFRMELPYPATADTPYTLCGYIDKVVHYAESAYVLDRKTSKSTLSDYYFEQYSPDNQFSLYSAVTHALWKTKISGVLIDAAQIAVGFTEFKRGMAFRNEFVLEEWLSDTQWWIASARLCAETNHWPQNDKSCHKFSGCEFRKICRLAPKTRQPFLDTKFYIEHWNPLKPRGGELEG